VILLLCKERGGKTALALFVIKTSPLSLLVCRDSCLFPHAPNESEQTRETLVPRSGFFPLSCALPAVPFSFECARGRKINTLEVEQELNGARKQTQCQESGA
jgi:hypothetical protein